MDGNYEMDDNLDASQGTGVLIPQAQIMEVLHNLNVSARLILLALTLLRRCCGIRCARESSLRTT